MKTWQWLALAAGVWWLWREGHLDGVLERAGGCDCDRPARDDGDQQMWAGGTPGFYDDQGERLVYRTQPFLA